MFPSWLDEILKANGLPGVFIFILLLGIVGMTKIFLGMLKERDAEIRVLHEQRAIERESLVRLLESANTAQRITADATARRNELLDDQTDAVTALATSSDRLRDRIVMQTEMTREKLSDMREIIGSTGESYRVLNGIVTEIRNSLLFLVSKQREG